MVKIKFLMLMLSITLLQSCWLRDRSDDIDFPQQASAYSPVIVNRSALESSTEFTSAKTVVNSGKIYVKGQYLFVNERNEGFHVIDNSSPENPINIGFITALGSSDLAIKDDVIYINNAVDLIAIQPDFSNASIAVTKRIPNTFPQLFSPDGFQYYNLQEDEIIVNWTQNN